jgi:UDP-N-acetylmuramoylalanine--D-glutamate ligase
LKNKTVENIGFTVLGAGRSGSGIAKLLKKRGARVFLSESSPAENLLYFDPEDIKSCNIDYETGGNSDRVYKSDYIIASPGIPYKADILEKARAKGIKVISEIEAASWFCNSPVIAITGTNGKTTTTVLTGELLKNAGYDVKVCGNVGLAFSEVINELNSNSVVVLEVSSFQLETIDCFKPHVSLLLNLSSDHIDWHGTFDNYVNAKFKINKNQDKYDYVIYNSDDSNLKIKSHLFNGRKCAFGFSESSEELIENEDLEMRCFVNGNGDIIYEKNNIKEVITNRNEILIKGSHNVYNSMASILAVKIYNVTANIIMKTLKEFPGVEHRIEPVREINGVKYYNDSKATNYDSLSVALESFPGNIVLIMGGKISPFQGVNDFASVDILIKERVKIILAIGQSKEDIKKYFGKFTDVVLFETLEEAVNAAGKFAIKDDTVLFSPGYKSFDMFSNFEHRGSEFKKFVNKI